MFLITSWERLQTAPQRRITTFSSVTKISFLNPRRRSPFHICSIGYISGVYGGIKNRRIFSGMQRMPDLCQAAPSQQRRIMSSGYCFVKWLRKKFMQTVLQYGIIKSRFPRWSARQFRRHNDIPGYDDKGPTGECLWDTSRIWAY